MSIPSAPETRAPHAASDRDAAQFERFMRLLAEGVQQGSFVRLVLSRPRRRDATLTQVQVRPLRLRGADCLSFLHRHVTRDETHNVVAAQGVAAVRGLLAETFGNAHLQTRSQEVQLLTSAKGRCTLRIATATHDAPQTMSHDREKRRWVAQDRPFLVALGVTDAHHRVIPAMARKWKQINKFIEVFAHALDNSPLADSRQVRVADFGSGKGYLTFALHDHLHARLADGAEVAGVELRPDMVSLCNDAVRRLGITGLRFEQGDVSTRAPQPTDVVIALHACDTATDHAIHLGIRARAAIIMCSPCCHKQLRPQLLSPHPLRPILQHGIHLGQEAEMLTDGLRALLLESRGYETQVFEFVSLEHTQKNKMILAVKRAQPGPAEPVLAQIREIKDFYGIREQCLETLLAADA
jgi:SAM-dependent methyltransferase